MSQKQINRYVVIQKSLEGLITVKEAAMVLGLSERQIIRLRKGVMLNGVSALIHKNKSRKPSHAVSDELKEKSFLLNCLIPIKTLTSCILWSFLIGSITLN